MWTEKTVDRESQQKLYVQMYSIIREKIEKNEWPIGTQIPTEDDLCKSYNVSKATVRMAITELVKNGYLKKQQGKGTFVTYSVPGLGIAMPVFVPPLVTALTVLVLSREHAAPLAYISGSLGTLIGADLLNLGVIQALGAPVASIGGAGTFDGIFVTALLAVILASFATRHDVRSSSS